MELLSVVGIILGLVAFLISIVIDYIGRWYLNKAKKITSQFHELYDKRMSGFWNDYYKNKIKPYMKGETDDFLIKYYASQLKRTRRFLPLYKIYNILSMTEIQNEVSNKIDEVKKSVEEIEKRFPKEATLSKIASVNDAILGTNYENLLKSVERIETKMLTRYDVVKIVFLILGAIGVLTGIVFGIIRLLSSRGGV